MLEKIVLILLITSIYSEIRNVPIYYLETLKEVKIENKPEGLLCVHIDESLKKDDTFYILFSSEEKNKKMDKTVYFNFTKESCQNMTEMDIDFDKLSTSFEANNKPNQESKEDDKDITFSKEYEIKKKEKDINFMLMLYKDWNGKVLKVSYNPISAKGALIMILVIIGVGLLVIAIIIAVICICCRKRNRTAIDSQYNSSYGQDPIMPDENNIQ